MRVHTASLGRALPLVGALLVAQAALPACGEEDTFVFEGRAGQAVPMTLRAWVPTVQSSVDEGGGAAGPMLLDTGAPLTLLTKATHPALGYGHTSVTLRALGLTFPGYPVSVTDLFEAAVQICQDDSFDGLIGGDLLGRFRLGLDYKGARAALYAGEGDDPPLAAGVAAPQRVRLELAGGGAALLPKIAQPVSVGATRLMVVEAYVEGSREQAMVDTGASLTVISKELLTALGGAGRPTLCCESVATLQGTQRATLTRLKALRLGGVTLTNVPVMVLDDSSLFTGLSAEVGRDVRLLVGGSFLRHFAVRLDYAGQSMELSRYDQPDHVSPDEFVLAGFSFCKAIKKEDGMVVIDVYQGSSAGAQGVKAGHQLLSVDGQSVTEMTVDQVRALLNGKAVGSTVKLGFKGTPTTLFRDVTIERLLADYP